METLPEQVRPGDLITADFMNRLLARLGALETRVDELTGEPSDGSVRIIQLIPAGTAASPLRVNDTLQILGENFGFSDGGHRVYFDSEPVTTFAGGSSDTQLFVTVPDTLSVPAGGRSVTLTVTNSVTTDTRTITVLPLAQTLSGDVDVLWRDDRAPNPDPNPIPTPVGAGQPVTFYYRLRSRANLPALFTIAPTVSVSAWQGSVRVLNASGGIIGDRRIELEPEEEINFAVRLTPAAPAPAGDTFTLNVVASAGGVVGSNQQAFTFDEEVEESDDQIELAFTSATVYDLSDGQVDPAGGSYDPATNTIAVAVGYRLDMTFAATFQAAEVHNVTVQAAAGTTGWSPLVRSPAGGSYDEGGTTPPVNEAPRFSVQPGGGASASGQVTFRIQREGETRSQSRTYTLTRL
ncbi:MAG TPA: IPT/TIG domain-containing protein [Rhodothermales bacterium]|nr:IPT/TIG domain-containing protein [Rhodothermales bacterium]